MNNINCDTNKIRSDSQSIYNLANEFYKNINNIINKIEKYYPNINISNKYIYEAFYNELCSFSACYEKSADILEESIINSKYE